MDKTKLKSQIERIGLVTIIVLMFFSCDYIMEMATDSYKTWSDGWQFTGLDAIQRNGRPVLGVIYYLYGYLELGIDTFYRMSYFMSIIGLIAAVYLLSREIEEITGSRYSSILCSVLVIINPFCIEYFMFLEKGFFILAILCTIIAVVCFNRYLRNGYKRWIAVSLFVLLFGVFSYQATAALFVIVCVPFLFYYRKSVQNYIINFIVVCLEYGICGASSILFVGVLTDDTSRVSRDMDYLHEVKAVIKTVYYALDTSLEMIPKGVWPIVLGCVFVVLIIGICKAKHKILLCPQLMVLMGVWVFCPTASIIVGSDWWCPRIVYPFGACVGVFLLFYLINVKVEDRADSVDGESVPEVMDVGRVMKYAEAVLSIILVVFIVIQLFSFQLLLVDKQRLTALDKNRVNEIGNAIEKYEAETGNRITSIALYKDNLTFPQYQGLYYTPGDLIVSSFTTVWSDLNAINYYLGADYARGEQLEEYKVYFADNEDIVFSSDQLVFDGDTLHLLVY